MNWSSESGIILESHLKERGYEPERIDLNEAQFALSSLTCNLSITSELQTQLTCIEPEDNSLICIMTLSVPITSTDAVEIYASAISLALTPVDLIVLPDQLLLRATAKGNRESLPALLDEMVLLIVHVSRTVCLPAVRLANGELTVSQAIDLIKSEPSSSHSTH